MKAFLPLLLISATLLSACGARTPLPAANLRPLQAQSARPDLQAQYFNVLLKLEYSPDVNGMQFGYDHMSVAFTDSRARQVQLSSSFNRKTGHFFLNLTRSGIGMTPVTEHVASEDTAARTAVVAELRKLSGSDDDNAKLALLIQVVAPAAR